MRERSIVFAGIARDVAPFLPQLRRNVNGWAEDFARAGLVLVENDSRDGTAGMLRAWVDERNAANPGTALLVQPEGLDHRHPRRTDRIAACRNHYLQAIAASPLKNFDYLAVLDMDQVNAEAPQGFTAALDFLEAHDDVAGVFANQVPAYYDIWSLRAPDWCPGDCWQEVALSSLSMPEALQKFVYERQRFIDPNGPPIPVDSAFGGLALYRMTSIRGAVYSGRDGRGGMVCEHVAFNRRIRMTGAKLCILPFLLNSAPSEHLRPPSA